MLGSPADEPRWACKRLPPFRSMKAADRYTAVFDRYLDELAARGVHVVETEIDRVPLADGQRRALLRPAGPRTATRSRSRSWPAVATSRPCSVRSSTPRSTVVDARVGLDAQLSNWAVCDGRLTYFDVTTPMLCTAEGRWELDTEVFLAELPWLLRAPVRRLVLPGIIRRYHAPPHGRPRSRRQSDQGATRVVDPDRPRGSRRAARSAADRGRGASRLSQ